jgi:hypothetical protein
MIRDCLCDNIIELVRTLGGLFGPVMAIWSGMSVRSAGRRGAGETETMMLSVAVHVGQAKVRISKPGLSGSRRLIFRSRPLLDFVRSLEGALAMPRGRERTEALKRAGRFQNEVVARGISFAKRGRSTKSQF